MVVAMSKVRRRPNDIIAGIGKRVAAVFASCLTTSAISSLLACSNYADTSSLFVFDKADTMSLQVNLSSRDITQAYQDVVNARGIDWAIFTYDKGTNDLKVQATGDGGLEELQEEFSDGR